MIAEFSHFKYRFHYRTNNSMCISASLVSGLLNCFCKNTVCIPSASVGPAAVSLEFSRSPKPLTMENFHPLILFFWRNLYRFLEVQMDEELFCSLAVTKVMLLKVKLGLVSFKRLKVPRKPPRALDVRVLEV